MRLCRGGRGRCGGGDARHRLATEDAAPAGDQARLWLYGVARNVLANHRRGLARRQDLSAALATEVADLYAQGPEDSVEFGTVGRIFVSGSGCGWDSGIAAG